MTKEEAPFTYKSPFTDKSAKRESLIKVITVLSVLVSIRNQTFTFTQEMLIMAFLGTKSKEKVRDS
jgi:hypothetical protein